MRVLIPLIILIFAIPASAQTFYFEGTNICFVNENVKLSLIVNTTTPLGSIQLNITFDPSIVKVENITARGISAYTIGKGYITIGVISLEGISGIVANITVKGVKDGISPLNIEIVDLTDVNNNPVSGNAINSTITVTIAGDFNGNGIVDIGDVARVAYMVVGKIPQDLRADFNENGRTDIGDLAKIAYYLIGKIDEL